ncbi:sister chromatid cohesion C-terminus-domain-containing protein [Mucor lusitanicus]|uniref:Sister chromatid cohesion protein n=1 Tax=Mucor circinelloides f. lusitanicus TaxID=29924 RepID=A0A8H4B7A7_MUCCL|nr:sister chromatid cohesion C-terminus-domain-containing protein [Mucor lusitanicus]
MTLLAEDRSDQFLKSLAIEWLGIICSKIKTGYNRLSGDFKTYTPEWICELNDTLAIKVDKDTPIQSLALLDQCRKKLLDHVVAERVNPNVIQFYLCNWGFIESVVWTKANKGWEIQQKKRVKKTAKAVDKTPTDDTEKKNDDDLDDLDEDITMAETTTTAETTETMDTDATWPKENALLLGDTCKFYWLSCLGIDYPFPHHDTETKQYEFPEMSRSDYMLLTELLASRQTLYTSYNFILSEILLCLDKDAVVYRTKALKAIGKIASEVPEIMDDTRIRASVVQRIHDGSPSVRDAAVDVVAKYLGRLDHVPLKLYEVVSARIMDTAVTVRKRLVKLLRELYFKLTDRDIKIDVASKLILRIGDNEVTISQLSLKATQEILFLPFKEIEKDGNDYMGYSYANSPKERKRKITDLTLVITGAVSRLDPSVSAQNIALSQIIQKTIEGADEKALIWYERAFQWIVDSLFGRMIKLEEEDDSTEFNNCLATAEWIKARYVLSIYRDVLPQMKYHDPEFVSSVERILMQLLSRCPLDLITDGISCLCVIVDTISFRYNILIKMLGSCISKLRHIQHIIANGHVDQDSSFAGVLKMILMCGLLCQNFEFDKKREQQPKQMEALNLVYKGDICTLVFDVLQFFTGEFMDDLSDQGMSMRMTALQGLGYFFASHPTYMISAASTALMDKIFEEGTIELKTQLMRVYQEFLSAEEKRIDKREGSSTGSVMYTKDIDINTLLGDTEEYAELGVNGSLMQRYLKKILKCALAESEDLRYAAFEVVSAIIHQGLAHPVLCMPAIVAAETSPDLILRNKAFYLHKYAHDKYGSLLYSQMNEYLSTSYQYQKILYGSQVQGYGKRGGDAKMDAVLGVTFSVMKDKKKARFDFFSALIKPFSFDLKTTTADEIDIDYLKYLAENVVSLDLSTTEEVLHMVYIMDRILMTLGADLLSYVHFLKKQGIVVPSEDEQDEDDIDTDFTLAAKLSLALCILMYMKNLLVELYDIPDE